MVKGVSRRVIVVKSPDPRIFEEAIFLVKEDVSNRGVTQSELLREAQGVASEYIRSNSHKRAFKLPNMGYALLGAGATAAVWLMSYLIF